MSKKKRPALKFNTPDIIKGSRRKHQLNQSDFWNRVGVTQSGGSRYESGRNIPTPVQILLQLTYGTQKQADDLLDWLRHQETGA